MPNAIPAVQRVHQVAPARVKGLEPLLETKLLRRVREEAHLASAKRPRIARARPVPGRVEPVLEDPVRELAVVAFAALARPVSRADEGRVVVLARVSARGLLAPVGVRALGPVVAPHSRAPFDLVGEHAELIRAVDGLLDASIVLLYTESWPHVPSLVWKLAETRLRVDSMGHFQSKNFCKFFVIEI